MSILHFVYCTLGGGLIFSSGVLLIVGSWIQENVLPGLLLLLLSGICFGVGISSIVVAAVSISK